LKIDGKKMKESNTNEYQWFIAEFYDYIPLYTQRPDIDFYIDFSCSAKGKTLELGCGTGRILIPTAAAGCEIVGLDNSEAMLAKCQEKLKTQPKEVQDNITIIHGNMISFDLKETFKLITIPFRGFQHLISIDDQLACLQCVNRHLGREGKLIFDLFQVDPRRLFDPAFTKESEDTSEVVLPDGRKFRRCNRCAAFHRTEQYNEIELIHYVTYPSGKTERLLQKFALRYFFRYEVEHLLARSGFRVVELFGNYDKSPLIDDSPDMIFVAEKCN